MGSVDMSMSVVANKDKNTYWGSWRQGVLCTMWMMMLFPRMAVTYMMLSGMEI